MNYRELQEKRKVELSQVTEKREVVSGTLHQFHQHSVLMCPFKIFAAPPEISPAENVTLHTVHSEMSRCLGLTGMIL